MSELTDSHAEQWMRRAERSPDYPQPAPEPQRKPKTTHFVPHPHAVPVRPPSVQPQTASPQGPEQPVPTRRDLARGG